LGADEKNIKIVFNKCDRIDPERDGLHLARLRGMFPDALYVSASTGQGLDELKRFLADFAGKARNLLRAVIPPSRHDLIALAHSAGNVYEENYTPDGCAELVFAIQEKYQHRFGEFLQ
jgi:GTP-binding protein HflX